MMSLERKANMESSVLEQHVASVVGSFSLMNDIAVLDDFPQTMNECAAVCDLWEVRDRHTQVSYAVEE
jgi:hypothetical protein